MHDARSAVLDGAAALVLGALLTVLALAGAATYAVTRQKSLDLPGLLAVDAGARGSFEVTGGPFVPLAMLAAGLVAFAVLRLARR